MFIIIVVVINRSRRLVCNIGEGLAWWQEAGGSYFISTQEGEGARRGESARRNCGQPVGLPNPAVVLYFPQQVCTPKRVSSPPQSVPPNTGRSLLNHNMGYPICSSQTPFPSPLCTLSTRFCLPLLCLGSSPFVFNQYTSLGKGPLDFLGLCRRLQLDAHGLFIILLYNYCRSL